MDALKKLLVFIPLFVALGLWSNGISAQTLNGLSNAELVGLTENGITLKLGAKGEGYQGSLKLSANGTGKGKATTDSGQTIVLSGTWHIVGDKFCRTWKGQDAGKEVCETWVAKSDRSVDVFNGDQRLGLNSW